MNTFNNLGRMVIISILIALWGCSSSTSSNNPIPPKVVFVPKSPDSAAVETGIDAEDPPGNIQPNPLRNGIFLQWFSVDHEDLQAYDVYRREVDTTGSFIKIGEVIQAFGSPDTTFLDTSAQLQTLYYYYVVARDEKGEEGERSNTEHYTLLPKPESLNNPVGNRLFSGFFDWTFQPTYVPQFFIFRLEKKGSDNEYRPFAVKLLELNSIEPNQHWDLQEVGIDSLAPGQYRWRIDIRILRDTRIGAESQWGYFIVQ